MPDSNADPTPTVPSPDNNDPPPDDDFDDSDDNSYGLYAFNKEPTETPKIPASELNIVKSKLPIAGSWNSLSKRPPSQPTKITKGTNDEKNPKRRLIVESDDDDEEFTFEDVDDTRKKTRNSPLKKKAKVTAKKTETVSAKSSKKELPTSLAIDGLGSSDDDDDEFIETVTPKHVKEKLAESQEKQKPKEKPRIKISKEKVDKVSNGKCRCKKDCTGHCGCVKLARKCTVACGCRGKCNNGKRP
jgi:hypothetical protein